MIGKTIAHFRIVDKIGEGGMGVVYKAIDEQLQRPVALKVLPPHLVENEERRQRLMREARAAAAVSHQNVATVYQADEIDGLIFIVMEFVEGQTLRSILKSRRLKILEALRYGVEIAEGLARAHQVGIIHRDLKPENIRFGSDQHPKILDFGLAKFLPPDDEGEPIGSHGPTKTVSLTQEGRSMGTPGYMPPEQALGQKADSRSDVFSFGVTLYEMVTGKAPFQGKTALEKINATMHEPVLPASRVDPEIPQEVEDVLNRCLGKDPDDRYRDGQELVANLDEVRRILTKPPLPFWTRLQNWTRHGLHALILHKMTAGALALLLVGIITGWVFREPLSFFTCGTTGLFCPDRLLDPDIIAVLPFTVRGTASNPDLGEAMVSLIGEKLDGACNIRSVDSPQIQSEVQRAGGSPSDPARASRVARRVEAGQFILGDILKTGDQLNISATIYATDQPEEPLVTANAEGEEEIFPLTEKLAGDLLTERVSGPDRPFARLARDTTESFPAIKAFCTGQTRFREGRYTAAVEAFSESIGQDPGFAIGQYRLGVAAAFSPSNRNLSTGAARAAMENAEPLVTRNRNLIEAFQMTWVDRDPQQAQARYLNILSTHPDEIDAWLFLGTILLHHNRMVNSDLTDAREAFERIFEYDAVNTTTLRQLQYLTGIQEDYTRSIGLSRRLLDIEPKDADFALLNRAIVAFAGEDPADRERVLEELGRTDDARLTATAWSFPHWTGDFQGAAQLAALLTHQSRSSGMRAEGHILLAHLNLARGRWEEARNELAEAASFDPDQAVIHRTLLSLMPDLEVDPGELQELRSQVTRLEADPVWSPIYRAYLGGRLSARLGEADESRRATGALEDIHRRLHAQDSPPDFTVTLSRDLSSSLRVITAAAGGDTTVALAEMEQIHPEELWLDFQPPDLLRSEAHERFLLAEMLEQAGRTEEALQWYGTLGQGGPPEIVYLTPKHFRLGRISERLGDQDQAVFHYRRVVELWEDCDDELRPLVEEAESRLANLLSG